MEDVAKRRPGRPRLNPPESDRPSQYIGFKADNELFGKLQAAGVASGRLLGPETRHRAAMTFIAQDAVEQSLKLFWGGNAGLIFLLAEVITRLAPQAEWRGEQTAMDDVRRGIAHMLEAIFDPEGTEKPKHFSDGPGRAEGFLRELSTSSAAWAETIRGKMGEELVERIDRRVRALTERFQADPPEPDGDSDANDLLTGERMRHLEARREQQAEERRANLEKTIERTRRAKRAEKPSGQ